MTLPTLTAEQRHEALSKAQNARRVRSQLKIELAGRNITAVEALDRVVSDPDVLGRMRVEEFLRSLPGIGEVRAKAAQHDLAIAETRRMRGLGSVQREKLSELCQRVDNRNYV